MSLFADYDLWLHQEAVRVLGGSGNLMHDDLVQEGRIAMWRSMEKYDPDKGAQAAWVTKAARVRMRDIAWGHGQPFGHQSMRGSKPVDEVANLDSMDLSVKELLEPVQEDIADRAVLAYHYGEIRQALDNLTPTARRAAMKLLTNGILTDSERKVWSLAKIKISAELDHLRGM